MWRLTWRTGQTTWIWRTTSPTGSGSCWSTASSGSSPTSPAARSPIPTSPWRSSKKSQILFCSIIYITIIYIDRLFTVLMCRIRRKTLYYMYNIVFPCMMMSTLTVLVFCMPPDSGEKIALGVTVILAFSVFMLAIAEKMPETSESIPLIGEPRSLVKLLVNTPINQHFTISGIYLTFVMAMTTISIIMTVIVLNFFYRGPILTEVPPWARRWVYTVDMNSTGHLPSCPLCVPQL